jgi:hypothetical protein
MSMQAAVQNCLNLCSTILWGTLQCVTFIFPMSTTSLWQTKPASTSTSWQLLIQQALCTYQSVPHHHPENYQPVFPSWCSIWTPTVCKYLPFNMTEQPRGLALPWPCQLNQSGIKMHRTVILICCCCTIHSLCMILCHMDELHLGTNNLNLLKCKNVKETVYFFVWVIFP